jgi:ankyrin repeat protein
MSESAVCLSTMINPTQDDRLYQRTKSVPNGGASGSSSFYSYMTSPKEMLQYLLGYKSKTKRSLAEEAENGDETSVNTWIRDGCNPNEIDSYGYTPLLNASALGRQSAVEELIKAGANVNLAGPYGFTPLHAAAQNGHYEVVSILLKHGAHINAQNNDQDTALHLALRSHSIDVVYLLVKNGANSRIEGYMNKDCVTYAKELGFIDLSYRLSNFNVNLRNLPMSSPEFRHA